MLSVKIHLFGVTLQTQFPEPVPFCKADIEGTAQRILTALKPSGLSPSQFEVIKTDELFNYDLRLNMFSGNGTFSLNAQRSELSFQNARTKEDFGAITRSVLALSQSVQSPEISVSLVNAHMHAGLESAAQQDQYFSRFGRIQENLSVGGIIVYAKLPNWNEDIRFQIDRSLVFSPGLFLNWTTTFKSGKLSEDLLANLLTKMEDVSKGCDIDIRTQ